MVKVVYFNQWFSSIANVIDDLKDKHGNEIKIIGSSKTKEHSYRYSVDVFVEETWEEGKTEEESMKNYVDYVLELCKQYKVDIFFVKKYAKHIMKRQREFSELGTFLVSEDFKTLSMMDSKMHAYSKLHVNNLKYIPEHYVFDDELQAYRYVAAHRDKNDICFKYDSDEGGASFRHIDDTPCTIDTLHNFRVNKVSTDDVLNMIVNLHEGDVSKLLFMEVLDSPEISVDCYNSRKGFIAICRCKESGRKQKIYYDENISKLCESIGNQLGLKFPYNVQFRTKHGEDSENIENLRLLEVNPRMSGGLYYEVLCGMNIAEICLLDLLHKENEYNVNDFKNFETKYITYVEKALLI